MDDEWDDSPCITVPPISNNSNVDDGHEISRGRGFTPMACETSPEHTNGFDGERRGRGGGRGGRGGRGGGRGRGGFDRGSRDTNGGGDYGNNDRYGGGGGGDRYGNDDEDGGRYGGGDGERRGGGGRGRGRGGRGGGRGDGDRDRDRDGGKGGDGRDGEEGDGEKKPEPVTYVPPEPTEDEDEIFSSAISSGINFDKFDHISVNVSGENPPKPIDSFQGAGFRKFVLDNILKSGYKKPTPIQKYAIPIVMTGRDLMGCAQTGSGKTAAFLLPMINMLLEEQREVEVGPGGCAQPQVVIVSPTRELTLQIFSEARKFSFGSVLKIAVAYGGTAVRHQGDNLAKGCHILVATPGRLQDFVDRNRVSFQSIRYVVLDEADRMLDMGFLPCVEKMMSNPSMVPKDDRQTLMFSATFPVDIQKLASKFLHDYLFIAVGIIGGASTDVEQIFKEVSKYEKQNALKELAKEYDGKRLLVFVETKRTADFTAALMSQQQYPTSSIHGDRMQREREEALHTFKTGKHRILVATAVAARGLDIKNVDVVVNYDLPKSIDEYVHRIGRTGRVGNKGKAVSFYDSEQDHALSADLEKILRQAEQPVPDFLVCGGTSNYSSNKYGGSDIRNFNSATANNAGDEPEEEW